MVSIQTHLLPDLSVAFLILLQSTFKFGTIISLFIRYYHYHLHISFDIHSAADSVLLNDVKIDHPLFYWPL